MQTFYWHVLDISNVTREHTESSRDGMPPPPRSPTSSEVLAKMEVGGEIRGDLRSIKIHLAIITSVFDGYFYSFFFFLQHLPANFFP